MGYRFWVSDFGFLKCAEIQNPKSTPPQYLSEEKQTICICKNLKNFLTTHYNHMKILLYKPS